MPTSKRRFLSADEPTTTPPPVQNPFRKIISAAGVLLILVMSVPMFADAVYGQSVSTNPIVDQTSNLVSALTSLSSQIGLLKDDISSLRTQLAASGQSGAGTPVIDTTMADCLESCRTKLSVCLSNQNTGTSVAGAPLDACRSQANTCMNSCRPRTEATVGCEDRCAVALGACVIQAGSDATKLAECRTQNRQCVINACRPRADKSAPSRVPAEVCHDQCKRDLEICKTAAAFDREELATCNAVATRCLRDVCTGYEVRSTAPFIMNLPVAARAILGDASTGLSTPNTSSTTPTERLSNACTDKCTSTFDACNVAAKDNPDAKAFCNASYGTCQETCRKEATSP